MKTIEELVNAVAKIYPNNMVQVIYSYSLYSSGDTEKHWTLYVGSQTIQYRKWADIVEHVRYLSPEFVPSDDEKILECEK